MSAGTILAVLKIVDLVATAAVMLPEVRARYDELSGMVKGMVEEGRDPTEEEWATINAETESLMAQLTQGQ